MHSDGIIKLPKGYCHVDDDSESDWGQYKCICDVNYSRDSRHIVIIVKSANQKQIDVSCICGSARNISKKLSRLSCKLEVARNLIWSCKKFTPACKKHA